MLSTAKRIVPVVTKFANCRPFSRRARWSPTRMPRHSLSLPVAAPQPRLTHAPRTLTLKAMEVNLNPNLQARLSHLAAQQGRDTEALAREAIERLVDCDEWFIREVEKGLAQIEQGKVLTHEEVGARMER